MLEDLAAGLVEVIEAVGVFADQAALPCHALAPKLLGLDVLLEHDLRPWLLEVERYSALGGGAAAVVYAVNWRLLKAMVKLDLAPSYDDRAVAARERGFTALFSRRLD